MVRIKAEDAGGLSPAKDDNEDTRHFIRRTLPIFGCVDYKGRRNFSFALRALELGSRGLFTEGVKYVIMI